MSAGYHRLGGNVPGKLSGFNNQLIGGGLIGVVVPTTSRSGVTPQAPDPVHPETELKPSPMGKDIARSMGYTGDSCSNCQSMKMKVSGHCMVCEDCGTTTGCS